MTSAINSQNIDGTYPIAGQDNDSQGFRDNFTNIKTNFQFAANEITDLQNNAVLKSALAGTTLNNNMGGSLLSNAQLQDMSETRVSLGTTAGNISLNYAAGPYYTVTTSGSVTVGFSNFPNSGTAGRMRLQITVSNINHRLILPSAVSVGTANIQGYANNEIAFSKTGTFEFEFETNDGGTIVSIFDLNRNRDPIFLPSSELLAANAAASLNTTTSYFTASTTATLAAGAEGQIKVLAMLEDNGDMVITVSNAGWKSSGTGTVTFNDIGDACTLLYVNSKWFCIGNNGCVFA
jgi:hypothetical protein